MYWLLRIHNYWSDSLMNSSHFGNGAGFFFPVHNTCPFFPQLGHNWIATGLMVIPVPVSSGLTDLECLPCLLSISLGVFTVRLLRFLGFHSDVKNHSAYASALRGNCIDLRVRNYQIFSQKCTTVSRLYFSLQKWLCFLIWRPNKKASCFWQSTVQTLHHWERHEGKQTQDQRTTTAFSFPPPPLFPHATSVALQKHL